MRKRLQSFPKGPGDPRGQNPRRSSTLLWCRSSVGGVMILAALRSAPHLGGRMSNGGMAWIIQSQFPPGWEDPAEHGCHRVVLGELAIQGLRHRGDVLQAATQTAAIRSSFRREVNKSPGTPVTPAVAVSRWPYCAPGQHRAVPLWSWRSKAGRVGEPGGGAGGGAGAGRGRPGGGGREGRAVCSKGGSSPPPYGAPCGAGVLWPHARDWRVVGRKLAGCPIFAR